MARRLRIQYAGALYHVINRGNYRHDVFATVGAAKAFDAVLGEACERHGWCVHAHATMRNHYHLALETPEPNLVDGMHWLQSTFAARFNRFRSEHGHLFQGRYQALVVEDATALCRVMNYIHLNPVQAGIVPAARIADFRWGSMARFVKGPRPKWLRAEYLLARHGLADTPAGWTNYVEYLTQLAGDLAEQKRQEFPTLSRGWAIGRPEWRESLARRYSHLAREIGIPADELSEIKETRWSDALRQALRACGKTPDDIARDPKGSVWKIEIASRLRKEFSAPHRWITASLHMGTPGALRVALWRRFANV